MAISTLMENTYPAIASVKTATVFKEKLSALQLIVQPLVKIAYPSPLKKTTVAQRDMLAVSNPNPTFECITNKI